jgi:hypothetical protein
MNMGNVLSPETGHVVLGKSIIGTLFKKHAQVRSITFDQVFYPETGVGLECPYPIDQFPGSGFFLYPPEVPDAVERGNGILKQIGTDIRKVNLYDIGHHIRLGKGDVVKVAAA